MDSYTFAMLMSIAIAIAIGIFVVYPQYHHKETHQPVK